MNAKQTDAMDDYLTMFQSKACSFQIRKMIMGAKHPL